MHQRKFFFYLPPPFFNLDPEESGTEIGQCMVTKLLHNATLAFCRRSVKIEMAANAGISPKISGPADSKPLDAWDDKDVFHFMGQQCSEEIALKFRGTI